MSITCLAVICITAHSGIINGFLAALGRPRYPLPTGGKDQSMVIAFISAEPFEGILPLVIKGVDS